MDKLSEACCNLWRVKSADQWNVDGQLELITLMIADSSLLYQWTVQHLCDQFVTSRLPQYCLLRVLLVGAVQKSGNPTALATDPTRK